MTLNRRYSMMLFFGFCIMGFLLQGWVVNSKAFSANSDLFALSITVDNALFIPLFYYLLVIRRKLAPSFTIVPVFLISVAIAHSILPPGNRQYLTYIGMIIPIVELCLLTFFIVKARKLVREYRRVRPNFMYSADAFGHIIEKKFGQSLLAGFVISEMIVIGNAVTGWFRKFKTPKQDALLFTYHKKSSFMAISVILLFMIVTEISVFHLLISEFSMVLAWVMMGLGIYSLLWFLGLMHSVRLEPIVLDGENLYLRAGILWRAEIPLSEIRRIQQVAFWEEKREGALKASLVVAPNIAVHLRTPVTVRGILRSKENIERIGIYLDDVQGFIEEMDKRVN